MKKLAVAIVSGGMDSVTLAYYLKSLEYDLFLLSFDYGQRHKKELGYASLCASRLNARHHIVDLSMINHLLHGSALTDNAVIVPDGHYTSITMKPTMVPNRNAIMLSIAYGVAVSEQADIVAIGAHNGDHTIYSDCRASFIKAFDTMETIATEGYGKPELRLLAPFVHITKTDIALLGEKLGVPYEDTWSCYKGMEHHCGKCGTCVERKEAFELAGIKDKTTYV